ncbi:MAG: transcriptional regulator [Candidatus Doudnabacteria bacterium]|nr:transcriptional regulator [Candidatus Doudnabacteria bacterium]
MKRTDKKSNCAINFSLEAVGDPWSLLIIRDIVYFGKNTYGEFLASDERIGTNVLAQRLIALEEKKIITKVTSKFDRRKEIYQLTNKGLDLVPILLDLAEWGTKHDPKTEASLEWIKAVRANRATIISRIRNVLKNGGSVLKNYNSIVLKAKNTNFR